MCTVIVQVGESPRDPVRLLAIRDEDPERPWDPLGEWWPAAHPGVVGVRDARAGGAWLAADPVERRLAVLLNRVDRSERSDDEVVSRGSLVLASLTGASPGDAPPTRGFNLVEVAPGTVRVTTWDGLVSRSELLAPGIHMIAHDDIDDPATARIVHWLPEFRAAPPPVGGDGDGASGEPWWRDWLAIVARSGGLAAVDDRALIRDNRAAGWPTLSLLICVASVSPAGVDLHYGELDQPGEWNPVALS